MDYDYYVGIDVGKFFHYVWVNDSQENHVFECEVAQNEQALLAVLSPFATLGKTLVVVDQPNNIGSLVLMCAQACGCECMYLPSKSMRNAARALNQDSKSDRIDADVICWAARHMPRALRTPKDLDEKQATLRVLKGRDKDLSYDETRTKNRLRSALLEDMAEFEIILKENRLTCDFTLSLLEKFGGPWNMTQHLKALRNHIDKYTAKIPAGLVDEIFTVLNSQTLRPTISFAKEKIEIPALVKDLRRIQKERKELAKQIATLLKGDEQYELLLTIPGIGPNIASTIRSEINIDTFNSSSELAKYVGVAPRYHESGTSIRGTFSATSGNRRLKDAMFIAARCSAQHSPISALYLAKKRQEGGSYASSHIALARKLVKVIFGVLKSRQPYNATLV